MCDVCCVSHAVTETKAGRVAAFRWDTRESSNDEDCELANNPHAPPVAAASAHEAAAPGFAGVFIEAAGEIEGPGRVRAKLAEDAAWGGWHDCGNLANVMASIGVDARWPHVKTTVREMIEGRQHEAFEAWLAAECLNDVAWNAGYTAGKACFHAGRLVPKRAFAFFGAAEHPAVWWRAFAIAIVQRTAAFSRKGSAGKACKMRTARAAGG